MGQLWARVAQETFGEPAPASPLRVVTAPAGFTESQYGRDYPYNLRPGLPDLSSFPREAWLDASRRALAAAPNDALGHTDPRGRPELREALAGYLARVRGVRTDPGLIVVCSGFLQATGLLGRALHETGGRRIAIEARCLPDTQTILNHAGLETVRLPVDADGARIDQLGEEDALLCTPSHQFPTGTTMPLLPPTCWNRSSVKSGSPTATHPSWTS